jgi:hypothetical protein
MAPPKREMKPIDVKLRLEPALHKRIQAAARKAKRSLNAELVTRLTASFQQAFFQANRDLIEQGRLIAAEMKDAFSHMDWNTLRQLNRNRDLFHAAVELLKQVRGHVPEDIQNEPEFMDAMVRCAKAINELREAMTTVPPAPNMTETPT